MKSMIKDILRDDPSIIIDILEELNFHDIKKWGKKEIRCSLPDGDNCSAVSIKLNTWINVEIYTRTAFEDYDIRDIFALIMFITGRSLDDTEQYLCFKTGLEYNKDIKRFKRSDVLKTIRKFKKNNTNDDFTPTYLEVSEFDKYTPAVIQEWANEGIDAETQKLFGVCISNQNERWCFPLYDETGLRAFKGRASNLHWKTLGLMKYLYMPKIGRNDIMFGYHLTKKYIEEAGEVIIVEGEKSVMLLWACGIRNVISVGKHGINPHVLPKIKKLRVSVVIASDKGLPTAKNEGITEEGLTKECNKLSHLTQTSYMWDDSNLLENKDAPIDKGLEVWNELYENKRRVS